jgi:hypothetical protein
MNIAAICKADFCTLDHRGVHPIACTSGLFKKGKTYHAWIDSYTNVNNGDLIVVWVLTIYDGGIDGFDVPSGVRFSDPAYASQFFSFEE